MALATTCPQCKTSFKVVPDQLKLRRGLVRCGACQHVFSGIDFLRYVDESKQARAAASAPMEPAGDNLQTAFFLPETILATPPVAPGMGTQPPARTPDAESPLAESPLAESPLAESPLAESPERATPEAATPEAAEPPEPPGGFAEPGSVVTAGADRPDIWTAEADLHADWLAPTTQPESLPPMGFEAEQAAPVSGTTGGADTGASTGGGVASETVEGATDDTADAIVAWGPGSVELAGDEREQIESLTATTPDGFTEIDIAAPEHDRLRDRPRAGGAAMPAAAASAAVLEEDEGESAIDYFSSARRGIGFVDRHGRLALAVAALLALLLGAQWTIAERSMIAARVPALAPALSTVLAPFGLDIGPPRDLGSLTIESFELRASGTPGVLAMSAILRNRAGYGVQWPSMQLTLTDAGNRVLVRKVLGPDHYLRETRGGDGLPPRAEWPVRLALEADDLQPAGYSVVLFYP